MYHCHTHIYLTGSSRLFELRKEMPPLQHFTHEFRESREPEERLAAWADVIVADLQDGYKGDRLQKLLSGRREETELIVIADRDEAAELWTGLSDIKDIWIRPMSDEELRFRFLKWQEAYKTGKDFWESRQYLDATINHVPNLIWYKDKAGIHEKVNDSFCRTVNKTRKQVEGRGHAYIWDVEEDDQACIDSEREVMARRETCVSEETVRTGDGMKLLTTYKSPLYDVDGSVMGTVGVAIDVTQERAYEQEIIEKNRTLETIFTTMDCGVMCHTLDGSRVISINRAALEILEYDSEEEMIEAGFDMVAQSVLAEDKEKLRQCIRELKKEGESTAIEYRVQCRNGSIRHVMGNVKLIRENGELMYQRFLLDWTARKLQEKENERQQTELIHALSIDYRVVCFFDLDTGGGYVLRIDEDDMFSSVFNGELNLRECMETYIENFVYEEDRNMLRQSVGRERVMKELSEKKQCYINHRTFRDGQINYFQMKMVRTGVWGENHCIVLGFRSVDEEIRHEMEQKSLLEDALDQANKANRAKSTFLSNMSHDIRTPMNAIVGFTSLAINRIDQKEQVEEYLKKIMLSGNHLLGLINDILDMSRIESGKMHLEEKPCSLEEILQGLRSILQADVKAKDQKLSIRAVDVVNDEICCDKLRLNQVLINLLSNAIKYTQAGGTISMTMTEKPGAAHGFASYEFVIVDNGIGMDEEFVARIFEPFEREKNSSISGIQGTGLGMAITKNIVDMMKGTIRISSTQGQGTEVRVSLAFRLGSGAEEERKDSREETDISIKRFHAGRILLAEDNELNQEIAAAILEDGGFTTEIADNGRMAVDMLKASEPGYYQVILMDVQMPVMNGYEATREIRRLENPKLASIPILAMTANAFEEDRREAVKNGMNGHLAKPIDIKELFDTLEKVLN